jgi:hypothetical protein
VALIDTIIGLIVALVLVYVGGVILWSLNPILGVLFIIVALYVVLRSIGRGSRGGIL